MIDSPNWVLQLPPEKLLAMAKRLKGKHAPLIQPLGRETGTFPLSFAQERLWFLDRLEPNTAFYNIPGAARLRGPFRVSVLAASVAELVRRHASLRTTFGDEAGRPYQHVTTGVQVVVPLVDLAALPAGIQEAELARLGTAEVRLPFDLSRGPLLRVTLFRLGPDDHAVVYTIHHIVSDGWSSTIFLREVAVLYEAFASGRPSPLPALVLQYADYASWQRGHLKGEVLAGQLDYWRGQLAGSRGLELPADRPRPAVETFRGTTRPVVLDEELTAGLNALARGAGASLFMVLLAAFDVLLYRYTGATDVPVGSPIANRSRREVEGMIGFFANTLVLRADLSGGPTFRELLARVKEMTLAAYAHEDLPFERVVETVQPDRDMSRNPLFQVMCVLQNQPRRSLPAGKLSLEPFQLDMGAAKFDFTVFWYGDSERLSGMVEHNTDLFDDATALRIYRHYEAVLAAAAADPERGVAALPLLAESERHQLRWEWNDTSTPGEAACVHRWVEEQARRSPAETALVVGDLRFSYREVDERANRLARGLKRRGVGPESRVGICLARSASMVVAALAVLKAGGALVALDPAYPRERLARIVEDAGLAVLLIDRTMLGQFPGSAGIALVLDEGSPGAEPFPEESAEPLDVPVGPDHPMYVIYTSGSTGQPKGIVVPHRAFANLLSWQLGSSPLAGRTRTVQFATFGFCVSFQEIFSALCSGGALVVADEMTRRDIEGLTALLDSQEIERLHLPYAALKHLAEATSGPSGANGGAGASRLASTLREVVTAGEQLRVTPSVSALFARLPGCSLHNQYGASETHVVSALTLSGAPSGWPAIPSVGRPVANVRIHLLDERMEPVPVGVRGELYAGGACLARGYWNDPELTAQKMVPDPFGEAPGIWDRSDCAPGPRNRSGGTPGARNQSGGAPGARLYRTGDLARYLANGEIEYLGRIDGQVKVRGFRVELGEVETTLARHPGVRDAAVVAVAGREGPRLAAYVVPEEGSAFRPEELKLHLKQLLPEYMVPASWVPVAALPLSANGKLDPAALPAPAPDAAEARAAYEPPRTPIEEMLCGIWAEVLGRPAVGARDDFFDLGGHSLLATQVVSRARAAFGIDLPLRRLFEAPVLAELARCVEAEIARQRHAGPPAPPMLPVPRPGPESDAPALPLSFAQERLWFLDRLQPGTSSYNMPVALWLTGRLEAGALAASLDGLLARHEALRTTFAETDGRPAQRIAPPGAVRLGPPLVDLSDLPPERREGAAAALAREEAARPFDLARGPLVRTALLRLAAERHVALFTMHHIVSDGWSMGVLVREIGELYAAACARRAASLPPLPVQYADFAVWQRSWLAGEVLARHIAFWRDSLASAPAVLDLPLDRPRPAMQSFRGAHLPLALPPDLGQRLVALGRGRGTTPFMTLLAGFAALLARLSGQRDVVVGTPVANRNRMEIEGLIGFFVNTLALRLQPAGEASFESLLARVRETTLAAYAHQDLPFERLVEELQPGRSLAHSPLFQVLFALQNAPMGALELPGLTLEPGPADSGGTAKFEMTLSLSESSWGFAGTWEYNCDLFDPATVARMAGQLGRLLAAAAAEPARPLAELPLLGEAERQQLREWNAAPASRALAPGLAHELFAARAGEMPEAVALVWGEERVSYGELARRAERLARRLQALEVGPERRVGLCLGRTPEMVIALLGVLAAGGAYVPLDPAYPSERLRFMARDAGLALVLAGKGAPESLEAPAPVVRLDGRGDTAAAASRGTGAALEGTRPGPDRPAPAGRQQFSLGSPPVDGNLAYVLYTSGSTGRPKGVAVTHRSVGALLAWVVERFARGPLAGSLEAVLASTSLAFDLSVFEILAPLSTGGRVVLASDVLHLPALAAAGEVTLVNTVPSAMAELLRMGGLPPSVRVVGLAGEPLPGSLAADLHAAGVGRVLNLYGPSEDTTYSTVAEVPPGETAPAIGRPIAGTRAHLLDEELRPVPVGVAGELCLAGLGLARGYLGRPDLTAERFVPDPCAGDSIAGDPGDAPGARRDSGGALGARLYRTGDLARFRPSGEIEFLGRRDQQVKLRGFRIELGEIEAVLARHPGVRHAAVTAAPGTSALPAGERNAPAASDPSLRLVAYVVPEETWSFRREELKLHLGRHLPEYMVPAVWMPLAALPLTANGKLDRAALPAAAGMEPAIRYVEPRTALEAIVADLWREVLGIERVGVEDDFFALGGHSLLATRVISRITSIFTVPMPLRRLFESPTVATLAAAIAAGETRPGRSEKVAATLLRIKTMPQEQKQAELAGRAAGASLP